MPARSCVAVMPVGRLDWAVFEIALERFESRETSDLRPRRALDLAKSGKTEGLEKAADGACRAARNAELYLNSDYRAVSNGARNASRAAWAIYALCNALIYEHSGDSRGAQVYLDQALKAAQEVAQ